jgi:hypothetical protein
VVTSAAAQPSRDRALGRGVHSLIPSTAAASPADQAAAALAALRTVPVPAGVLQAAAVLLEELAEGGEDERARAAAAATVAMLRQVLSQHAE